MLNCENQLRRLNFRCALVIVDADDLRIFIVELLRRQGWLVHGIRQMEQAFNLVAQIPYELIIIDHEAPGGIDHMRSLQKGENWVTFKVVLITSRQSTGFSGDVAQWGAFLARKARWADDLCEFLSAYDEG